MITSTITIEYRKNKLVKVKTRSGIQATAYEMAGYGEKYKIAALNLPRGMRWESRSALPVISILGLTESHTHRLSKKGNTTTFRLGKLTYEGAIRYYPCSEDELDGDEMETILFVKNGKFSASPDMEILFKKKVRGGEISVLRSKYKRAENLSIFTTANKKEDETVFQVKNHGVVRGYSPQQWEHIQSHAVL